MKSYCFARSAGGFCAIVFLVIGFASGSRAAVTSVAWYRLGEKDPGAVSGNVVNTTTVDLVAGRNSRRFGTPRYTNLVSSVASNQLGSSLSVLFSGASFFSNAVVSTARDNFGIEAWVDPSSTAAAGTYFIAHNGRTTTNGWGLAMDVRTFPVRAITFVGEFGGGVSIGNSGSRSIRLVHLALVRNNGVSTFYVNGVPSGSTNTATPATPAGGFAIAATPQAPQSGFFPGVIDEVRVFTFAPGQFTTADLLVNQRRVVTSEATELSATGATLQGVTGLMGLPTAARFEFGTTTNLDGITAFQTLSTNVATTTFSQVLTGLTPGLSFFYRAVTSNAFGVNTGNIVTFDTRPSVATLMASNVSFASATLNGTANPKGLNMTAWFEWGLTTNYGNVTPPRSLGSGGNVTNFSETLTNLFPGGTFHYRAVASNSLGLLTGTNQTFQTPVPSRENLAVFGVVTVRIQPPGAVAEGASWMLDDGLFQTPGLLRPSVTPGHHTVRFRNLPNWIEPPPVDVFVVGGRTAEVSVVFAPVPVFDFQTIPEQHARHGETTEFFVRASNSIAPFQITATPPVAISNITYDAVTGRVAYTPAAGDRLPFTLTFSTGGQSATATITPLPNLPLEDVVLNYDRPLPDDESRDYITISEVRNAAEVFNDRTNQTLSVDISGKTLVFDTNHPALLHRQYSGRASMDIKEFRLFADRVIIRSPLILPQAHVSIHARELRFEGAGQIITTPEKRRFQPKGAVFSEDDLFVGRPGDPGHPGGDADVLVERFHADPSPAIRFVLRGGQGGNAGEGRDGVPEMFFPVRDTNSVDGLNTNWVRLMRRAGNKYCFVAGDNAVVLRNEIRSGTNVTSLCGTNVPAFGEAAVPSGIPGAGGRGGTLRSTLNLSAHADLAGGTAGTNGSNHVGGTLISRFVYRVTTTRIVSGQPTVTTETTDALRLPGANAAAPIGTNGAAGSVIVVNPASWLHSFSVRGVLQFVRDAYLNEKTTEARAILADYRDAIRALQPAVDPNSVTNLSDAEFAETTSLDQLALEIDTLIHRIDSNLDFFGNPAGWVPMLSFEANLTAFQQEVDQSIPILYLAHWLSHAATNLQNSLAASTDAVARLKDELDKMIAAFNQAQILIPNLKVDSEILRIRIGSLQTRLLALEAELLARAQRNLEEKNKLPFWKKALGVLSVAADLVPIGQPTVGRIGNGLEILTHLDASKPLSSLQANKTNIFAITANKDISLCFTNSPGATNDPTLSPEQLADALKKKFKLNSTCAKFLGDELEELAKLFKDVQVDSKALAAELEKIKASDPVFQAVTAELKQLNEDKEKLAQQLAAALQAVSTLGSAITENTLATDQLERRIAQTVTALDHNALQHIKEMERRAKDRLLKFQYFVAKSFQYRLLQPFNGNLQLTRLFDRFQALVATNSHVLSLEEFNNLKALYTAELRDIVNQTLAPLNVNAPERSQPASFNLLPEELDRLNREGRLVINLRDKGFFASGHENIRIVDLRASQLNVRPVGGTVSGFALCFVDFEHRGVSRLTRAGESFLFRHYQTEAVNPITWNAIFDGVSQNVTHSVPSPAAESLIRTLINQPNDDKLLLFSRPSADADILITKKVSTANGIDLVIDAMSIQVQYEFFNTVASRPELTVSVIGDIEPVITLSQMDLNSRRDGQGDFRRVYPAGTVVTLQAPTSYGGRAFDRWLVNHAPRSAGLTTLTLTMSAPLLAEASFVPAPDAPMIVQQPQNTAAAVGSAATFTVIATGTAPLTFRWRKDAVPLTDGSRIAGTATATLVISNVGSADAAAYSVVVSNAFATSTSQDALLSVTASSLSLLPAGPGSVGFQFGTVMGLRYIIERKFALTDPVWTPVETNRGSGGLMQFTRPTSAPTAFFRLRVE